MGYEMKRCHILVMLKHSFNVQIRFMSLYCQACCGWIKYYLSCQEVKSLPDSKEDHFFIWCLESDLEDNLQERHCLCNYAHKKREFIFSYCHGWYFFSWYRKYASRIRELTIGQSVPPASLWSPKWSSTS